MAIILGIETSCDETAAAVYDSAADVCTQVVHSQVNIHQAFGGVVPELAARDHIRKMLPVIERTLKKANIDIRTLEGIAYTQGPGLMGALMVGASVAKGLARALNIPTIGIHHLEAHLMIVMLESCKPSYPFLSLLVSGGHTMLVKVDGLGKYAILGESLDDAAGEAFDKTAKLLGLPYPGGPELERLAQAGKTGRFTFPRPMIKRSDLNFSFSGIKTFAVQCIEKMKMQHDIQRADLAADFQAAIIDALLFKTKKALKQTGLSELVVAGGVSANLKLRAHFKSQLPGIDIFYPSLAYCTDNAAMVAFVGALRFQQATYDLGIDVKPRWPISTIPELER
jgi:N6-L-threonylcarbamoyladenine synthase